MKKTRLLKPSPVKTKTHQQWVQLATRAIAEAERVGDLRRARLIRMALQQGKPALALKKLGIICDADIQREFGPRT